MEKLVCDFILKNEYKGLTMSEKNKLAGNRWKTHLVSEEDKQGFACTAKNYRSPDINTLNEDQVQRIITKHKRQLIAEILLLEELGCNSSLMLLDSAGDFYNIGSAEGISFLRTNPDVVLKFRTHFYAQTKKYNHQDVQRLFNKKYSEAVNKPGSRVPYQKGGFTVENLPPGIVFKRPYNYGSRQAKAIMEVQEDIRFVLVNEGANVPQQQHLEPDPLSSNTHPVNSHQPLSMIQSVLTKIAGKNVAEAVLAAASNHIITEDEVEVTDLRLTQEDRLILWTHCSNYFDLDAWSAVGHNIKVATEHKGIILPVYTEAEDEHFWLFYCPSTPLGEILKPKHGKAKLQGYWLNLDNNYSSTYGLLLPDVPDAQQEIQFCWIIKCDHGPIYLEHFLEVKEGVQFIMPDIFKNCILETLKKANCI